MAGPHVDLDFERNVIGKMKRPVVVGSRVDVTSSSSCEMRSSPVVPETE